ncbi:redoxin domain-containing protein [Rudaea sp.]|uniref:redoxin domain-containing protein n=1 Tax=Rudaea sp. TaxID=2136325 RepID=UPI002ED23817
MSLRRFAFVAAAALCPISAFAAVAIGTAAPDFSLTDSKGKTETLSQYKGKTVVLEWNNPGCPFVQKHYSSGNIPKQQADATKDGVVWLTINSGAAGKQGHLDGAGAQAFIAQYHAAPSAYLFDADGKVGRLYGARTTPHMYVIDAGGTLRYMGGIDSIASTDKEDLAKATQYVPQALAELKAGKPVSVATSEPYGCSVKYGS